MQEKRNRLRELFSTSAGRTSLVFALIMLALIVYGLFIQEKGAVEVVFNEEVFAISTEDTPIFIRYEDVESAELISADSFDAGEPLSGHAGNRYLQGLWRNEQLGEYRLSVNTRSASYVLLRYTDGVIVFSANKTTQTEKVYQTLTDYLRAYQ